jgi:RNA recognition motif-containing protein
MKTKLFVGNLSSSTTEEDLSALFAQTGKVDAVELIAVREPGNSKYFAFIDMSSPGEAKTAVGMLDGSELNGRALRVKLARPREARPVGGGWYTDSTPPRSPRKGSSRRKAS